jgi:hypothetical protein
LSVLVTLFLAVAVAACGGGGADGGDVEPPPPAPGGTGTGAGGAAIFWTIYEWNVDAGAALAVRQTDDGGYVSAGYQLNGFNFSLPPDFFVQKVNALGARQWSRRIPWPGGGTAHDVRPTGDGGYIVAGTGGTDAASTVVLFKLDANGNVAAGWPKTYEPPPEGREDAAAVLPINGGNDGYLVAGSAEAGPLYVLRLNAAGDKLWEKFDYGEFCGGGGRGSSTAMTPTADGNYVIAGRTGCSQWAGFLLKIAAANGNELWRRIIDDTNVTAYTGLTALVETSDQSLVAVGLTGSDCGGTVSGTCDALVVKTDASGNEAWRRRYGGAGKDGANGVAVARDGSYLVAGFSHSYGGAIQDPTQPYLWMDAMLLKIAPDGTTVWQKIKGLRPRGADVANAIIATADGGFAVGGSSGGDVMLAKFDANGETVNLGATYDLTITVPATQGAIDFNNAVDVAGTGAYGLILPREVGGALLDRLIAASSGAAPSTFCSSGTYAFDPAVPATLTAGGSYQVTFTDCVFGAPGGEQLRIGGSTTLLVDAVSGTPASGTYEMQMTANSLALTVATVGTTTVQEFAGGLRIARTATGGDFVETVSSPTGVTLAVTETSGGNPVRAATYGPFSIGYTVPTTGSYSVGAAGNQATAAASGNTFTIVVLQSIMLASSRAQPASGNYRLTAQDNSRLTATITGGAGDSTVALAVDTDSDGTDDGTLSVPWDFVY